MEFPTIAEVNVASRIEICRWHRFLPSAINEKDRAIGWDGAYGLTKKP